MEWKRRSLIRGLGALGASVPLGACGPSASPGSPRIANLVLVMMENRSFDHYYGALSLVEGRGVDGLWPERANLAPGGGLAFPSRLTELCPPDPPHDWFASRAAFDAGGCDGFVQQYSDRWGDSVDPTWVLDYLDRTSLPISYALADGYTLCQRWFASVMGPTWPNRLYSHGAQSQGMTTNDLPDGGLFTMKTIYDLLDEAGESWGYFFSDAPFLLAFGGLGVRDEVQPIDAFYDQCASGTLPSVSVVEPAFSFNDDHPPHNPLLGQLFLSTVHAALARSPQWGGTLLVFVYDEHGGFADHVAPPKAADDLASEGFDQLGFRVPAVACGPWVRRGAVCDTIFDHTSWLAEIERWFGLPALTARDAAANDLASVIDESPLEPRPPAELPVLELTEEEVEAQCAGTATASSSSSSSSAARSLHQPELADLVARFGGRFDRRGELDLVAREALTRAAELGALRIL